jgi:hypothetical protein
MKLSQRIWVDLIRKDRNFSQLKKFCAKNINCLDELTLFFGGTHSGCMPLKEVEEDAFLMKSRMAELRELGFKQVGINVLCTIGHIDEGYSRYQDNPYATIVGYNGARSKSCLCPVHEDYLHYIAEKYRIVARSKPDFLWVDDDIKLFWNEVKFGCFCDTCMDRFNRKNGTSYDRESLVAAMEKPDAVELRKRFVKDTSDKITELLGVIKNAVRETVPDIPLGFMTQRQCWSTYNGMSFADWFGALDAVKGRPGEGFYRDAVPDDVCTKVLSCSRQAMEYSPTVTDIQYEVENFPYHIYEKSRRTVLNEATLAVAAGMNGVLLNTLDYASLPEYDYSEVAGLYKCLGSHKPMWNRMEEFSQGFDGWGFYPALSSCYDQRRPLHNGESFFTTYENTVNHNVIQTYSICQIGVPLSMDRKAACGVILAGDLPDGFTDEELGEFLSGVVIMDAGALAALERRGLGKYTGVRFVEKADKDCKEYYNTTDPINSNVTEEYRCIHPAFWGGGGAALEKLDDSLRVVSYLCDAGGRRIGIAASLYENELGGRVCVLGYGAWHKILSYSRRVQMAAICDYLTRNTMQAKILSSIKAAEFIRISTDRKKTLLTVINLSLDPSGEIKVAVRNASRGILLHGAVSGETPLTAERKGEYGIFTLPSFAAYDCQALLAESAASP